MPLISSPYKVGGLFRNGHFSTIYSAKLRPSFKIIQSRERLELDDGDFIDIDWSFAGKPSRKLAVLFHGLEGNARRIYMKGQARILTENCWDAAAVNYRGCSGSPNRLYESYHGGRTDDIEAVIAHILSGNKYDEIALIGFSLGGNMIFKYLGERREIPSEIKKAVAISTPLSLSESLHTLNEGKNWLYRTVFVNNLRRKYEQKLKTFPEFKEAINGRVRTLLEFDNRYTAPAHGFEDAFDYYEKSSCIELLPEITIPVLLLNARNDSFLSPLNYPSTFAEKSKNFHLEMPAHGGHVGFYQTNRYYYSEKRALQFIEE